MALDLDKLPELVGKNAVIVTDETTVNIRAHETGSNGRVRVWTAVDQQYGAFKVWDRAQLKSVLAESWKQKWPFVFRVHRCDRDYECDTFCCPMIWEATAQNLDKLLEL